MAAGCDLAPAAPRVALSHRRQAQGTRGATATGRPLGMDASTPAASQDARAAASAGALHAAPPPATLSTCHWARFLVLVAVAGLALAGAMAVESLTPSPSSSSSMRSMRSLLSLAPSPSPSLTGPFEPSSALHVAGGGEPSPVSASDVARLCIHFSHKRDNRTAGRLGPFLLSCSANAILCSSGEDESITQPYIYHGYVRRRRSDEPTDLSGYERGCKDGNEAYDTVYEFAVDVLDDATYSHHPFANRVSAYFKTSRSTELMEWLDPDAITSDSRSPKILRRYGSKSI